MSVRDAKEVEIEDLRARVQELEDQLNEKIIDNTNTHVKLKGSYEEIETKDMTIKTLKSEYQWLAGQYNAVIAELHDKLDELNYNIKHCSLAEVLDARNEQIKAAQEAKAQQKNEEPTVLPKPPIPKDVTEEQMNPPKGYA